MAREIKFKYVIYTAILFSIYFYISRPYLYGELSIFIIVFLYYVTSSVIILLLRNINKNSLKFVISPVFLYINCGVIREISGYFNFQIENKFQYVLETDAFFIFIISLIIVAYDIFILYRFSIIPRLR